MDLDKKTLSQMLETAIVSARLAGQKATEELACAKASVKNGDELVTQTDAKCQQIIIDRIKETHPDHGFIAEEGGDQKIFKRSPRGSEDFWWVIDPIDGTTNFVHHIPLFAVSIALCYQGRPVVGVIFSPATDSMFTAVAGGGAYLNSRRITAGEEKINTFASVGLCSTFEATVPPWASWVMQNTKYRNLGSVATHIAYVAKASFIAAICPAGPKLWDIAAATLIAESAGAIVTDWAGKKLFPLDLESYQGQKFQLLAGNTGAHAEFLKLLAS